MPDAGQSVRVASWNIHRCLGGDRRRDASRVARIILALDADVVALQEVETPTQSATESSAFDLLYELASAGYEVLQGPTMVAHNHHYGNVLLSRLPVRECVPVRLAHPGREPRGLIDARLDLGRRPQPSKGLVSGLRCMATHLGLGWAERRAQIADIATRVSHSTQVSDCPEPMVLLGDFNEWSRHSRRLSPINRLLQQAPIFATFPARWPLLALDRIWYRGCQLQHCESVHAQLTRIASDHLPLLADIRIDRPCIAPSCSRQALPTQQSPQLSSHTSP